MPTRRPGEQSIEEHQQLDIALDPDLAAEKGSYGVLRPIRDALEESSIHLHDTVGRRVTFSDRDLPPGDRDEPMVDFLARAEVEAQCSADLLEQRLVAGLAELLEERWDRVGH